MFNKLSLPLSLSLSHTLQVMQGKLVKYFELSAKLGGDIAQHVRPVSFPRFHVHMSSFQAEIVKSAFQVQVAFITSAGTHKAPPPVSPVSKTGFRTGQTCFFSPQAVLQGAMKPTSATIERVQVSACWCAFFGF